MAEKFAWLESFENWDEIFKTSIENSVSTSNKNLQHV